MNDLSKLLDEYVKKNPTRFHMPGHKGRHKGINEKSDYYCKDISDLDFSDNLFSSTGVILKLKKNIKDTFNSLYSYPLINGSSCGVTSAILGSVKKGEKILLSRNSHISAYYGISMSMAEPVFLYPKDITGDVDLKDYIDKVKNENIKAVFITYPNYFGYCIDLKKLIEEIKKVDENIIVIVDESHGAHLHFANKEDKYPISASNTLADIVINSVHKTLIGLTQTSMLHIYSNLIDISNIESALKFTQSTSPSYLFLSSIEEAIEYAKENGGESLKRIKEYYFYVKNQLKKTSFYIDDFNEEGNHDYLKLCINTSNAKITSYELLEILENEYAIYLEFAFGNIALCYLGLNTTKEDVERLIDVLYEIDRKYGIEKNNIPLKERIEVPIPIKKKKIEECMFCNKREIDLIKSEDEICADFVIPYPPGYPVLIPGDKIDKNMIEYLQILLKNHHKVVGINDNKILTFVGE